MLPHETEMTEDYRTSALFFSPDFTTGYDQCIDWMAQIRGGAQARQDQAWVLPTRDPGFNLGLVLDRRDEIGIPARPTPSGRLLTRLLSQEAGALYRPQPYQWCHEQAFETFSEKTWFYHMHLDGV